MIDFHFVFLVSFFIFGIHYLLGQNKTPFSWLGYQLEWHLPEWMAKPVLTCPICMASIYTTIFYWFTHEITFNNIIEWAVIAVVVAGVNRVLLNFIN